MSVLQIEDISTNNNTTRPPFGTLYLIGRSFLSSDGPEERKDSNKKKINKKKPIIHHSARIDRYSPYSFGVDAKKSLFSINAGGNSLYSEALSIQYFVDLGATQILLEKQVQYDYYNCKMVDFVMTYQGKRVGVSVARAMSFGKCAKSGAVKSFGRDMARTLLQKKLLGLVLARNCVSKQHSFFTSILHLQCQESKSASILQEVYQELIEESRIDPSNSWHESLQGDFYLIITKVCEKSPYFHQVFNEQRKKRK